MTTTLPTVDTPGSKHVADPMHHRWHAARASAAGRLETLLRRMRLPYLRAPAPDVLATAKAQRWDPAEVLRVLINAAVIGRDAATRRMRRKTANFPSDCSRTTDDHVLPTDNTQGGRSGHNSPGSGEAFPWRLRTIAPLTFPS